MAGDAWGYEGAQRPDLEDRDAVALARTRSAEQLEPSGPCSRVWVYSGCTGQPLENLELGRDVRRPGV